MTPRGTKILGQSPLPPGGTVQARTGPPPAQAAPSDKGFRVTTLDAVARYTQRHRYLRRGGEFVEIADVRRWAKNLRVFLVDEPAAFLVLARDHPAFVRQGRDRRAS
jgi:hypothetical protein